MAPYQWGALAAAGVMSCGVGNAGAVTVADRIAAATAVATADLSCTGLTPFYWEIGDAGGPLGSGQGGTPIPGASKTFTSSSALPIASGSKWVAATLMVEQTQGQVTDDMQMLLTMSGGYVNFDHCSSTTTVAGCLAEPGRNGGSNGDRTNTYIGAFYYDSGHMQVLGDLLGYGGYDASALSDAVRQLPNTKRLIYSTPELAGGMGVVVNGYTQFLRNLISGTYSHMKPLLGSYAVCTTPNLPTCPSAVFSPINNTRAGGPNTVSDERWHYSLGHWVEDDPVVGDGAFSSPGKFGFYPWVDASKTWYGVIARNDLVNIYNTDPKQQPYVTSVACGRKIRAAWVNPQALRR